MDIDIDVSKMIDKIYENEKCVKYISGEFAKHMTRIIKSRNVNIYDLLHDFYCSDAENCDRFEYKHFPADELRACYNCVHYACCDERG